MKYYDFLVLGSGIAGLVFALEASKKGRVAIVTKKSLYDCNTEYAQGGIAAVLDATDSFARHCADTYEAGAELGKKEVICKIIQEGPRLMQYLIDQGTDFTRRDPNYDKRLENLSPVKVGTAIAGWLMRRIPPDTRSCRRSPHAAGKTPR